MVLHLVPKLRMPESVQGTVRRFIHIAHLSAKLNDDSYQLLVLLG